MQIREECNVITLIEMDATVYSSMSHSMVLMCALDVLIHQMEVVCPASVVSEEGWEPGMNPSSATVLNCTLTQEISTCCSLTQL